MPGGHPSSAFANGSGIGSACVLAAGTSELSSTTVNTDRNWELVGYSLWGVGSLLFAISAWRHRDELSFVAAVLFLAGIAAVIGQIIRR